MVRSLRSEREISSMRRAGLLVWQAHQIAAEMIRPGITTAELDAAVDTFYQQQSAHPLFKNYPNPQRGKPAFPAVTCMSINEEVVHGIPSSRELKSGDVLSIDTGCRIGGWCGDAAITHPIGEVDIEVQRLLDATQGVLKLAVNLMGEKQRWSEVAKEMAEYVAAAGFETVEDFVGHGIGREMHEDPQVPNYLSSSLSRRHGDFQLRPGLVIAVEPMVNIGTKKVKMLADQWTMVTRDGSPSAHFEHTIAVTHKGPRLLTGPPLADEPEWTEWGRDRLPYSGSLEEAIRW